MKSYNLDTTLNFGQHKGFSVLEILEMGLKPYIGWCILNLDHFLLDSFTLSEIEEKFPFPEFDQDVLDLNDEKIMEQSNARWQNRVSYENWQQEQDEMKSYFDNYNDDLDPDQQSPDFWNQF